MIAAASLRRTLGARSRPGTATDTRRPRSWTTFHRGTIPAARWAWPRRA